MTPLACGADGNLGHDKEGPPIPAGEIIAHSANTHVIPADNAVARTLARVRLHDVV